MIGKVEIKKKEIPGSRRSVQGYILTYSRYSAALRQLICIIIQVNFEHVSVEGHANMNLSGVTSDWRKMACVRRHFLHVFITGLNRIKIIPFMQALNL